jgi:hypothetical protein
VAFLDEPALVDVPLPPDEIIDLLSTGLAALEGVATATYGQDPPRIGGSVTPLPVLPHSPLRTGRRIAEQALANALYGAR